MGKITVEYMDGVTRTRDADAVAYEADAILVKKAEYYGKAAVTVAVIPLHNVREVRYS